MAHLHAILATDSPTAILIKRGPGRVSCTIGWDRRTDLFELGQWLKQRIDHDAADLSPDGQHFCYFVNTQRWGEEHSVYRVVSKAPWLKALAFWSTDSWTKGPGVAMFFRDENGSVKLLAHPHTPQWDHLGMEVVAEAPNRPPWSTMMTGCYLWKRLQRDGWTASTGWTECPPEAAAGVAQWFEKNPLRIVFVKGSICGWSLYQFYWCGLNHDKNRGTTFETFALMSPAGEFINQPDWEWADFDALRNRLVWTAGCRLYCASITAEGLGTANLLLNTEGMRFEPRQAPY